MTKKDYTEALFLFRRGKILDGINILRKYNDNYFIKKFELALTPSEIKATISELKEAIEKEKYGNSNITKINGSKTSLLEILNIFYEDDEAFFYPTHKNFNYNVISGNKKQDNIYPEFIPNENVKCSFNGFTWHKEQLNLSVLCKIDGIINLPDNVSHDGKILYRPSTLSNVFNTYQWRNYSIIFNGKLNINKLPITASPNTLEKIKNITNSSVDINDKLIYTLDLRIFPLVTENDIHSSIYAYKMCNLVVDELILSTKQKIFKSLLNKYSSTDDLEKAKIIGEYTKEESEYLDACGIRKDGSYNPPVILSDKKIVDAVLFKIDVKGYSSIPSLSIFLEKQEKLNNQVEKYTPPMLLVKSVLDEFEENTKNKNNSDKVAWLNNEILKNKIKIKDIKKEIQKDKLVLLLTRTWFKDISTPKSEEVITIKMNKFPGTDEVTMVIRVHRQEIKK